MSGVRWQDKTRIIWDPYVPPCPLLYNVHRIKARVLLDVDGNKVADDSGECFQHDLDDPEATDTDNPPLGFTQFYQVTRENSNGEGPLGPASNGLVPPNDHPCPSTLK